MSLRAAVEETTALVGARTVAMHGNWAMVNLDDADEIRKLGPLFAAAYTHVKQEHVKADGEPREADR
jgi:hypothetical protein